LRLAVASGSPGLRSLGIYTNPSPEAVGAALAPNTPQRPTTPLTSSLSYFAPGASILNGTPSFTGAGVYTPETNVCPCMFNCAGKCSINLFHPPIGDGIDPRHVPDRPATGGTLPGAGREGETPR
jgi:hypothetical protein